MLDETIAAIATPLGQGGLAIIRLSGDRALTIADSLFAPGGKSRTRLAAAKTHTLHYGHSVRDGQRLDEVIVSVMKAPATFTREDVVEISCHGGIRSTKAVLDAVLDGGRGWPCRASSPSAPFCTDALISRRPRRSPISSTREPISR